jgi:hypothetical protein
MGGPPFLGKSANGEARGGGGLGARRNRSGTNKIARGNFTAEDGPQLVAASSFKDFGGIHLCGSVAARPHPYFAAEVPSRNGALHLPLPVRTKCRPRRCRCCTSRDRNGSSAATFRLCLA